MVPCKCDIPKDWKGEEVQFLWNANNEGMIWTILFKNLREKPSHGEKFELHLEMAYPQRHFTLEQPSHGEKFELHLEMAYPQRHFTLEQVELAIPHKKAWQLLYDLNNS
ncbi:hypothetical protein Glove_186g26 [Diversispora epigaea]|uniref:Alpha-mannosidase Ams1-like N-terminal domain-containing protein n=1 Tax=Diversispora epigaea TaxID=1348612 RepID=A0A397IMC1_9GLOM|nr:hypothetical protein Glove_186g26 [Diversispora epigaea]